MRRVAAWGLTALSCLTGWGCGGTATGEDIPGSSSESPSLEVSGDDVAGDDSAMQQDAPAPVDEAEEGSAPGPGEESCNQPKPEIITALEQGDGLTRSSDLRRLVTGVCGYCHAHPGGLGSERELPSDVQGLDQAGLLRRGFPDDSPLVTQYSGAEHLGPCSSRATPGPLGEPATQHLRDYIESLNPVLSCETAQPRTAPLIDDFEDQDPRSPPNDGRAGVVEVGYAHVGSSEIWFEPDPSDSPRPGTVLHLTVEDDDTGVNLALSVTPELTLSPYPACGYDGIAFWARGFGVARLSVATADTNDDGGTPFPETHNNHYGFTFSAQAEWQYYEVRFEALEPGDYYYEVPFDMSRLTRLIFGNAGTPRQDPGSLELWLDDVSFIVSDVR